MTDIIHSIVCLKSAIAGAMVGDEDPAETAELQIHLDRLRTLEVCSKEKLEACIAALSDRNAYSGTNRKVVLARAQRYLTALAIELTDMRTDEPQQQKSQPRISKPMPEVVVVNPQLLSLKGIGPKTGERLSAFGLDSPVEILFFLPRRYDDRRYVTPISQLKPGMRSVTEGTIQKVSVFGRPWKRILQVEIKDGDDVLLGMWFSNRRPNSSNFSKGQKLKLAGLVGNYKNRLQIAHPIVAFEGESSHTMNRIVPIYPIIPGVPQSTIEKAIRSALDRADEFVHDPTPQHLLQKHDLIPLIQALKQVHCPPDDVDISELDAWVSGSSPAHRRLAYDEFLFIQLALSLRKNSEAKVGAPAIASHINLVDRTAQSLGFTATDAQQRVILEIQKDLGQSLPMRRLLQGDVGSGKTMVALAALIACAEAGYQAALMAPTEILAEQHMRTLFPVLKRLGIHAALHLGNARAGARKKFMEHLHSGRIQIAIGTHALISESVLFSNLALAIVDEQHRFGVSQRLGLQGKARGKKAPHLLVMTATPIPRSLALTVHGDLDISVLDELPPGRSPVHTEYIPTDDRNAAMPFIRAAVKRNEQVYVVCPIIEQSETLQVSDAENAFLFYQRQMGDKAVGLLHGRLSPEERDDVMDRFVRGELSVLVSTTVIEVGVNVPNATLMIIEGCERFGLAQLHQLRGRVGRDAQQSKCILLGTPSTDESRQRVETLTSSNDGFHIAEQDLQIRGPGELYGKKQAGLPGFKFGNLKRDLDLLIAARQDAQDVLTESPGLDTQRYAALKSELKRRILAGDGPIGEESG